MWITGCDTAEELQEIFYGAAVPDKYQSEVFQAYLIKSAEMMGDDTNESKAGK